MKTALLPGLAMTCLFVTAASQGGSAPAAPKVPGEKWRQSFSMQMQGMRMPQQTFEYCVPVGKAQERAMMPPDDNRSCELRNLRTVGNRTTATLQCKEPEAMTAEMDVTSEPDHIFGTNRMKSADGEILMSFDSRKLGSCMADDPKVLTERGAMPRAAVPAVDATQQCTEAASELARSPGDAAIHSSTFLAVPTCRTASSFKAYCTASQTHDGFLALDQAEAVFAGQPVPPDEANSPMAQATYRPLTTTVEACGLGKGSTAITALKGRLLASADAAGAWDFLAAYGDEAAWTRLRALARQHCTGRSFTNATDARYRSLCVNHGATLVANERRPAAGAVSFGTPASEAPASVPTPDAAPPSAKPGAQEAVEAGKKILRGLFGR